MAKDIHTSVRISHKNESDLYELVNSKGGVKKALLYLYNQYQINKQVDTIVDRLKSEIEFTAPRTITNTKPKATDNKQAVNLLTNFAR